MPMYEYQCRACGHVFDKLLSMSRKDEPKGEPCPNCQKQEVQEHITGSNFQLNDVQKSSHMNDVLKHIHDTHKAPDLPKR